MDQRASIVAILREISDLQAAISIADLAQKFGVLPETVESLLFCYGPLGLFKRADTEKVLPPAEYARPMLRSLAFCIEDDLALVDDWERKGAVCTDARQMLDRGVCLLSAIEHKRVDVGHKKPSQTTAISKVVIKRLAPGGDLTVLMMLNQNSCRFELVGGKARQGESPEKTLYREISEEISSPTLRNGRDYDAANIGAPAVLEFVSPTTGAYTKYIVNYFSMVLKVDIAITPDQRWVSLVEIAAGKTHDGYQILPAGDEYPEFYKMVREAPVSFVSQNRETRVETVVNTAANGQSPNPVGVVVSVVSLLGAFTAAFWVISNFAPNAVLFLPVVGFVGFVVLVLVARMYGWISAEHFFELFRRIPDHLRGNKGFEPGVSFRSRGRRPKK